MKTKDILGSVILHEPILLPSRRGDFTIDLRREIVNTRRLGIGKKGRPDAEVKLELAGIRDRMRNPVTISRVPAREIAKKLGKTEDRPVSMKAAILFSFIDMKAVANNPIAELRLKDGARESQ